MARNGTTPQFPRNGLSWTEEEDCTLRFMAQHHVPIQQMSKELGRSQGGIMQRGTHLGVRVSLDRPEGQRRRLPWTAEEDAIVLECAVANDCTLRLPHRTIGSIWQRKQMLRMKAGMIARRGESQTTAWDQGRVTYVASRAEPSEDMLMDAKIRSTMPRPIVAWIQGDPPPGYSALDRRRGT